MPNLSDYKIVNTTPYMFRNKLMNGAMNINERVAALGTTVSLNGDGPYPYLNCVVLPDRWFTAVYSPGANTITANVRQSDDVPAGTPFQCSYQFTTTAGSFDTSPIPAQDIVLHQFIEGYDNAEFNYFKETESRPLTLSFWVKSSVPGTHSGSWRISPRFPTNGTYSYVFEYTINQKNTWEYKTISIPKLPPTTLFPTPEILTDSEQSNSLVFKLGTMGLRVTTLVNTWLENDFHGSTNSVRVTDTTGATFFLTGVQLEVGTRATPFDLLPYDLELKMCQRYYSRPEVTYQGGGNFGIFTTTFPNIMRTVFPTVCSSGSPSQGFPRNDYFCCIGAGASWPGGNPNTLNIVDAEMVDWVTDYRGRNISPSYLNQAQGYMSLLLHFDETLANLRDHSYTSGNEIDNAWDSAKTAINLPVTNATTGVSSTAVGTTFATIAGFFKFGTQSLQLPANFTAAYLAIKNSDRFNFGYEPWSIDFWFRSGTIAPTLERRVVFSTRNAGSTAGARIFFEGTTNNLLFNFSTNGANSEIAVLSGLPMGTTSSAEFVHFAVARYKDTIRTYRNGILQYTYTKSNLGPIYHNILDQAVYIGGIQAAGASYGSSANGYIDEFRIVKGKAIYNSSNFTPPTIAYPTVFAPMGGFN